MFCFVLFLININREFVEKIRERRLFLIIISINIKLVFINKIKSFQTNMSVEFRGTPLQTSMSIEFKSTPFQINIFVEFKRQFFIQII